MLNLSKSNHSPRQLWLILIAVIVGSGYFYIHASVNAATLMNSNSRSVRTAVEYRDLDALRIALAAHKDLEERDEIGSTPLNIATGSGQFMLADLLIDAGANVWACDRFGINTAGNTATIGIPAGTEEGDARIRVIAKLKALGVPYPPPPPDEVLKLVSAGQWPPPGHAVINRP